MTTNDNDNLDIYISSSTVRPCQLLGGSLLNTNNTEQSEKYGKEGCMALAFVQINPSRTMQRVWRIRPSHILLVDLAFLTLFHSVSLKKTWPWPQVEVWFDRRAWDNTSFLITSQISAASTFFRLSVLIIFLYCSELWIQNGGGGSLRHR